MKTESIYSTWEVLHAFSQPALQRQSILLVSTTVDSFAYFWTSYETGSYCVHYACLLLLIIMPVEVVHLVAWSSSLSLFNCSIVFHCMDVPQFICPFFPLLIDTCVVSSSDYYKTCTSIYMSKCFHFSYIDS